MVIHCATVCVWVCVCACAKWISADLTLSQPVYLIYILIAPFLFAPKDRCIIALICTVPRPVLTANCV